MSFEAIVDDTRLTTDDRHPMITIAHHEPMDPSDKTFWISECLRLSFFNICHYYSHCNLMGNILLHDGVFLSNKAKMSTLGVSESRLAQYTV